MNKFGKLYFLFIVIWFCIINNSFAQIEEEVCFTFNHEPISLVDSWNEDYYRVKYRCICNGDETTSWVQLSTEKLNEYRKNNKK